MQIRIRMHQKFHAGIITGLDRGFRSRFTGSVSLQTLRVCVKCLGCILFVLTFSVHSADSGNETAVLRNEIDSYRSKIREIRKNIEHTAKKALSDSLSYMEYLSDNKNRFIKLTNEYDSLLKLSERLQKRRDSLSNVFEMNENQKQSIRGRSDLALNSLRKSCGQLLDSLLPYSPFNMERQINALKFLESEIAAGTINVTEGLERYWQIVTQIEQASQKIETWKGPSPTSALIGDVNFFRLGFVWIACTGNESSTAFYLDLEDGQWKHVKSTEQVAAIHKAVQLSTGMAVPQLIALPVNVHLQPVIKGGNQ